MTKHGRFTRKIFFILFLIFVVGISGLSYTAVKAAELLVSPGVRVNQYVGGVQSDGLIQYLEACPVGGCKGSFKCAGELWSIGITPSDNLKFGFTLLNSHADLRIISYYTSLETFSWYIKTDISTGKFEKWLHESAFNN